MFIIDEYQLTCELATLAKTHQHPPGLCKAVVTDLLVFNSSVKSHLKHVSCAFCSLPRQCRLLPRCPGREETFPWFWNKHCLCRYTNGRSSAQAGGNHFCGIIKTVCDPHGCLCLELGFKSALGHYKNHFCHDFGIHSSTSLDT